jgi:hypothetical protein
MQKAFQQGLSSLTQGELTEWIENQDDAADLLREYERKIRSMPTKWREYRERWGVIALPLSANPEGRPRKDALADEAKQLQNSGLSYAQIAIRLNREHGEGTTTKENIRGLLKYRRLPKSHKAAVPPEKT